jgi:hypothetical protein
MKRHLLNDFIKFKVSYLNANGNSISWEGYAEINTNYNLRIFNPHYKVNECCGRNFYFVKLRPWCGRLVNERYIYDDDIVQALTQKLAKLDLWGFRYYDDLLSITIYSKYGGEWKQAEAFRFLHSKDYMETVFLDGTVKETHHTGEVLKDRYDYVTETCN